MLGDPAYTFRRHYVDQFLQAKCKEFATQTATVLDLGGRREARRGQFDPALFNGLWIMANITSSGGVDVVTDAQSMAFRDDLFDIVFCSEVLEHVHQPQAVIREINRVLEPHGVLIATVPFFFPIHGHPEDHGRYTQEYWKQTLNTSGFDMEVTTIDPQGSFASSLVQLVVFGLRHLTGTGPSYQSRLAALMLRMTLPLLRRVPRWDERTERAGLSGFPSEYGTMAFKSGTP